MEVHHGAVGTGVSGQNAEVLIPASDVGAGRKSTTEHSLARDKCEVAQVPTVLIGDLCQKRFSNGERCGILKIDIKGAELRFLSCEEDFLQLVNRLVR